MKSIIYPTVICLILYSMSAFATGRETIRLNGKWQFEQTDRAFPPQKYSRTIPVPGFIHLAEPKIEQYDKLYAKSTIAQNKTDHRVLDTQYDPKYNWYRKTIVIPKSLQNKQVVLSIKKSQYVTTVYVNGMDAGSSMECYTPIDLPITPFIKFGESNEIVIRVGDRNWLPSQAAGSTDKEKVIYLPGIWDDVELSFTGMQRLHKVMVLPSLRQEKATVKILVRNFYPAQQKYGDPMEDSLCVRVSVCEKSTGKIFAPPAEKCLFSLRDNLTFIELAVPMPAAHSWSPDDPFLYEAHVEIVTTRGECLDAVDETFGMRDFSRHGKFFYLNGERCELRGTNITLHRFFEDPDCHDLPWDRKWVTKLLSHYPKQLNWNAMRVCVGIAPDFWVDIADSVGMMFQNEWLYWQDHGWDEQIRSEYSNWVWSDGSHPSIIIWDAINENWNEFVGNVLIPDLKKLDPTRIWDAGYMTSEHMAGDEMDEPHPYSQGSWMFQNMEEIRRNPLPLGDLHHWTKDWHIQFESSAAQLVNEYGWVWLWRNGYPSHLTKVVYDYYLAADATPEDRWEMQAYWLQ
ncbi:MAG: glycoside hydrolase family 2, partial [Calditrichaeota bacterium]